MSKRKKISPTELIRKVRQLEISTRQKTKDVFSGGYHSNFKGMGITFSEVRPYQYGDDIRSIDWNVTAKTGAPHIKIFEEERELSVILAVDISQSTLFGAHQESVNDKITEICASLAVTAQNNGDKIGLLLFSSANELYIPPKKGKGQLLKILRELILLDAQQKQTNTGDALKFLRRVLKKHHLVFVISDFLDMGYAKNLSLLSQKHEIIGVRVWDVFYNNLPTVGLVRTIDPETGTPQLIDFGSHDRALLLNNFHNFTAYFNDAFIRARSDKMTINTDASVFKSILEFFNKRNFRG